MKKEKLPPGQREVPALLRWNINHPGIVPENPKFDPKTWILTVGGEVNNPLRLTWEDLLSLPSTEFISDFHCVEGWSVKDLKWYGVRFSTLVHITKPKEGARNVLFTCSDGYTTSLDLDDLLKDDVVLAYKLNGEYLEVPIGGPVRLVVPNKYAYKSAMWINRITFRKERELGYWEKRGYSDSADIWKSDRFASRRRLT